MKRIFGSKAPEAPAPSIGDTTGKIAQRSEGVEEKIQKIQKQLLAIGEQLKTTRAPAQKAALKQRGMQLVKQKRMYEGQRNQLFNNQMNLESMAFSAEQLKDTTEHMAVMSAAAKGMRAQLKVHNIDDIEKLQDEMADLHDMNAEIQDALGRSYAMDEDIDEDELMGELDALEGELAFEVEAPGATGVPSYLEEIDLPSAPTGHADTAAEPYAPLRS